MNFFDDSNSIQRPTHRGFGGPVQNDIMRYLQSYAPRWKCERVFSRHDADIIITNDVFSPESLELDIPRVKRMDGVFSRTDLITRNEALNQAATQADHVIFISQFSKNSFETLYPELSLKSSSVVLNVVDPQEFPRRPHKVRAKKELYNPRIWGCSATHWDRPEKRLQSILKFSEGLPQHYTIHIIGSPPCELPERRMGAIIKFKGYCADYTTYAQELALCDAFLNFSYQDPAPKTVCQAISVGLPVLFAQSGGTGEIVQTEGVGIKDNLKIEFEEGIQILDQEATEIGLREFQSLWNNDVFYERFCERHPVEEFNGMLDQYFSILHHYANIK